MKICKKCLYTECHPLNIIIHDDGICSGCKVHEEKDILYWNERFKKLENLTSSYINKSSNNYDCIVPVSGARDSFFIVDIVKNKLGLNPLLVTYNKQYNTSVGVRNLAKLRHVFDLDIMTLTISPEKIKKITRATLRRIGSVYWHCIAGQTVFPVQIAVKFKIPLIIWGAHQGIDQVGMYSHLDEVEMTRKYRKEHDLMGLEAEDLICEFDGITDDDIRQLKYPHNNEIEKVGVRGIYLNNYIRWDSRKQHELMIKKYNYETCDLNRTFDRYNDVDCYNYSDIHDYIKFIKCGFGKVLDHASREIRLGNMSRYEGINLVKDHMFKPLINFDKFLDWIGIEKNAFNFLINLHRNENFWYQDDDWNWKLKFDILEELKKTQKNLREDISENKKVFVDFIKTKKYYSSDSDNEYILIGKGVK